MVNIREMQLKEALMVFRSPQEAIPQNHELALRRQHSTQLKERTVNRALWGRDIEITIILGGFTPFRCTAS